MDGPQLLPQAEVAALYEKYPYPPPGLLSGLFRRVRWEERQTLNYKALYGASFGTTEGVPSRPRILVAGCGTFEPIVVALANPSAEIVAIDLSARSLAVLRRQAWRHGVGGRILALQADLLDLPPALGLFHFVIATGVLHHLPDPLAGMRALAARAEERAVFRFMVYSYWGRSLLYAAKRLATELGARTPAQFRRVLGTLPPAHPYRIYFHAYGDSASPTGIADGFLHPCDQAFTARELRHTLSAAGLQASHFLHGIDGQPAAADALGAFPAGALDWDRLAVLEAFGELQENFRFVACREGLAKTKPTSFEWNEALPPRGRFFVGQLGREVAFDQSVAPSALSNAEREELAAALLLVPA